MGDLPPDSVFPATLGEWRDWLAANHSVSKGVWLVTYKKAAGKRNVDYGEAVEEALCWGWIDSVARGLDDHRTMLRYTPRKPGSGWSDSNKERLIRLEAEGRMQPPGRVLVDRAKADGTWDKLQSVDTETVPADLLASFAQYPGSESFFQAFPPGEKRRLLRWIAEAKTASTREKRLDQTARLAQVNQRANDNRDRKPKE